MKNEERLFNVVAVNLDTNEERILAENKTERNAEAIVNMAVMRLGVEKEFFKTVPVERRNKKAAPMESNF